MSEKRASKVAKPGGSPLANAGPMDMGLLEQLVKLMADNGLTAVELSDGDQRISLKRGNDAPAPGLAYAYPPQSGPASASHAPSPDGGEAVDDSKLVPVKSPMPGTFYSAPAKGAKPFITVGAKVEEETDVCIIEAMKVFNTIKAEARGTVAKILVQDSQPVEFGQILMLIKPG